MRPGLNQVIGFVIGILTSAALELIPGVREAWSRATFKRLILLVIHAIAPLVVWSLPCYIRIPFPFTVQCDLSGIYDVVGVSFYALIGNQATYSFATSRLPNARLRNREES
jgi:hypothetical protein